jgi:hypothetical protein
MFRCVEEVVLHLPSAPRLPPRPSQTHVGQSCKSPRSIVIQPTSTPATEILLLPRISQLLNQVPQQPNFADYCIMLGDDTIQRVYLLDVVYKQRLNIVELGLDLAEGGIS